MIYTVGTEMGYDDDLQVFGAAFQKKGRTADYAGGFALRAVMDAVLLIYSFDGGANLGKYAVYEVDADWETDTTVSDHGWWHALLRDAQITRKVLSADEVRDYDGDVVAEVAKRTKISDAERFTKRYSVGSNTGVTADLLRVDFS